MLSGINKVKKMWSRIRYLGDVLLNSLGAKLLGFEHIKSMYVSELDFYNIYKSSDKGAVVKFYKHEEYLFRENNLCS